MFCPSCGSKLPEHVKFCTTCGKKLPDALVEKAAQQAARDPNPEASPPVRQPERPAPVPAQKPKRSKAPFIILGAVAAVLLIAALSVFLFSARLGSDASTSAVLEDREEDTAQTHSRPQTDEDSAGETASESSAPAAASTIEAPAAAAEAQPSPVPSPSPSPEPLGTDFQSLLSHLNNNLTRQGSLSIVASDMSDYPNVKLYVNYTDTAGEPILLTSPTAGITEAIAGGEEIERTIRSVERLEGNEGIGFDILVDKSDSMSGDMAQMQQILQTFIRSMDYGSGDHAEIISFDSYIMYMCSDTSDMDNLLNGIANMTPYGMTALYDALVTGINNAASRIGPNCVIAFTDGNDNESTHTYPEVIQLALEKGIPLYLIGTGGADSSILSQMAEETGGHYWDIQSIGGMDEVLQEIYKDQKNMYCIEYVSDEGADPYALRTISCVLEDADTGACAEHTDFQPAVPLTVKPHSSRYEIIAADISWSEANNICIANGGHLATITSQEEMDLLTEMATQSGLKYLWIGGYTSVRDNQAFGHWTTGEPFDYTAWFPGEPSRNDKDGTPEFYLMLWYVQDYWSWNDQRDDVINDTGLSYFLGNTGYICEYED